jgi:HEPN domain-containing protein
MQHDIAQAWDWFDKAEQDRSAARRLFTPGCLERAIIAFHCQQAAEKYLKAFLVSRSVAPERTHDLSRIRSACSGIDPAFEELAADVDPLTLFAVATRYPGPPEPTHQEVAAALLVVERLRAIVVHRLPAKT